MATTQMATRPQQGTAMTQSAADYWSAEQKQAIRNMLVPPDRNGRQVEITDAQLAVYAEVCRLTDLDPWTRQIYLLPLDGGPKIHISIDGLRAISARVPEGVSTQVFWKAKSGEWQESWEGTGAPFAAMAVVKRGNSVHRAVVHMSEFPAKGPNQQRPAHYIAIVAERHGLRKACPFEIAGTARAAASAGVQVDMDDTEPEPARLVDQRTGEITERPVSRSVAPARASERRGPPQEAEFGAAMARGEFDDVTEAELRPVVPTRTVQKPATQESLLAKYRALADEAVALGLQPTELLDDADVDTIVRCGTELHAAVDEARARAMQTLGTRPGAAARP